MSNNKEEKETLKENHKESVNEANSKKKEKGLYKKWWFWLILLAIVIVIGFTTIMVMALNIATGGIHEVALAVQKIDSEATVYTSAGGNTIVIEIPNYSDDTKKYKEEAIKILIKGYTGENGILSNYSKAILCEKINSDDNIKDYFLSTKIYTLPDMTQDIDNSDVYIDFIEYTKKSLNTTSTTNNSTTTEKGENITLTAGKYIVGEDIKQGKYDAVAKKGSGNFFVHGSSSVNEILSAKNDGWGIEKYSNLNLKSGDTLEITSSLSVELQAK